MVKDIACRGNGHRSLATARRCLRTEHKRRRSHPNNTVEGVKEKLAIYAELNNWEPGCSTPNDIADCCYSEGHPFRLLHAATLVYSIGVPSWGMHSGKRIVCMNTWRENGFVYNAEEAKVGITQMQDPTLYEAPPYSASCPGGRGQKDQV